MTCTHPRIAGKSDDLLTFCEACRTPMERFLHWNEAAQWWFAAVRPLPLPAGAESALSVRGWPAFPQPVSA